MESALYITSVKDFKKVGPDDSRVYFGAEFCQWRTPGAAGALGAFRRAADMGLGFTLLTPWVTDAGMVKLRRVFDALAGVSEGSGLPVEVVVNDLGVLSVLNEKYPVLSPLLGRLMVRQKRCPRIPGLIDSMPESGREIYLGAGVNDPLTAGFFKGMGVHRVELDAPLQGLSVDLAKAGLKGTVYTPYAYVTTTRHCPASFDGHMWQSFTGCRLKGCLHNVIRLVNPAHDAPLLMRGNTQFVDGGPLPEGLEAMGIDRVVRMPDIP